MGCKIERRGKGGGQSLFSLESCPSGEGFTFLYSKNDQNDY
jgi:hypothetical protein